jgi:hypothetical protein
MQRLLQVLGMSCAMGCGGPKEESPSVPPRMNHVDLRTSQVESRPAPASRADDDGLPPRLMPEITAPPWVGVGERCEVYERAAPDLVRGSARKTYLISNDRRRDVHSFTLMVERFHQKHGPPSGWPASVLWLIPTSQLVALDPDVFIVEVEHPTTGPRPQFGTRGISDGKLLWFSPGLTTEFRELDRAPNGQRGIEVEWGWLVINRESGEVETMEK